MGEAIGKYIGEQARAAGQSKTQVVANIIWVRPYSRSISRSVSTQSFGFENSSYCHFVILTSSSKNGHQLTTMVACETVNHRDRTLRSLHLVPNTPCIS
jgi:hypothetical protein